MRFCPVCKKVLVNTLREGVDIDYCPQCRGVWLDRNELEKIIEHVKSRQTQSTSVGNQHYTTELPPHQQSHHIVQHYPPPVKDLDSSYLAELFDFDD